MLGALPTRLISFFLLFLGALAASDGQVKLANRTIERTVQLRTHSLFAPYIDQDLQNRWWDFGADSYVNTNRHVRLTRNRPSQMGWLWSRLPLTSQNFIVEIEFKISGDNNNLYGDGLAMWLTKGRAKPGPVFGNEDKFEGLGVFLDTYANSRHSYPFPRVVGMLGDGETQYDLEGDGEKDAAGACSANYRRSSVTTKLKITYMKGQMLDVKIQHKGWDDWSDCFTIKNVTLPNAPFIGFSALTGAVSDNHDIISVTTYSAILSPEDKPRDKLRQPLFGGRGSSSKDSSWSWFIIKLLFFAGVGYGAWYGYKEYQRRQRYGGFGSVGTGAGFMSGGSGYGGGYGGSYYDSKRF